jgi:hypothetical protein
MVFGWLATASNDNAQLFRHPFVSAKDQLVAKSFRQNDSASSIFPLEFRADSFEMKDVDIKLA